MPFSRIRSVNYYKKLKLLSITIENNNFVNNIIIVILLLLLLLLLGQQGRGCCGFPANFGGEAQNAWGGA